MRAKVAWVAGTVTAAGLFLATPPLVPHAAAPPSSLCSPPPSPSCTLYETRRDASGVEVASEVSDVVDFSTTIGTVPSGAVAIVQNPNLPPTDPHNWSDVVDFISATGGGPGTPSTSVQEFSEGCGNPSNPFDIGCFPPAASITQFVVETQTGQGSDFTDCTTFLYLFQTQGVVQVTACSDAALNEAPNPDVPEVPVAAMLPVAGLGILVVGYLRRRRGWS